MWDFVLFRNDSEKKKRRKTKYITKILKANIFKTNKIDFKDSNQFNMLQNECGFKFT